MEDECIVEGCGRLKYTRGMCQMHYRRVLKKGHPGPPDPILRRKFKCQVDDWAYDAEAKGYCHGHYQRLLRSVASIDTPLRSGERLCSVKDCGRPHKARGFCAAPYKRFLATGDPQADRQIREVDGNGPHQPRLFHHPRSL